MSIIRILAVIQTQILQLANYANDAKTIAWSIKRDKLTHMLLRNCFASWKNVQGPTSRHNFRHWLMDKSRECVSQIIIKCISRTRYLPSPFVLPYILWFKQRDVAKRHKACVYWMSCDSASGCTWTWWGSMEKRRMLLSNNHCKCTFIRDTSHPRRGGGGRRRRAAIVVAIRYADDGAKLTVSVVLCIPFRIGNVI